MPQYKLIYFDVWGLCEPIRFILKYGGLDFEDFRIRDKNEQWKQIKPTTPYGQVPVLEINGKPYAQTIPICHYLAKQLNLLGKTDLDALQIDGMASALLEFRKCVSPYFFENDPVLKQQKKEELLKNTIPFYMNKFESLAKTNGGYLHGGELSYADLFFVAILDAINNAAEFDITKDYCNLNNLKEKVRAIPRIKAWLEQRPKNTY